MKFDTMRNRIAELEVDLHIFVLPDGRRWDAQNRQGFILAFKS